MNSSKGRTGSVGNIRSINLVISLLHTGNEHNRCRAIPVKKGQEIQDTQNRYHTEIDLAYEPPLGGMRRANDTQVVVLGVGSGNIRIIVVVALVMAKFRVRRLCRLWKDISTGMSTDYRSAYSRAWP